MTLTIGNKIKELRTERHVTQEQLAVFLSVTPQAVSRWESGYAYPDMELLPAIADYFSVTTDELLGVRKEVRQLRLAEVKKEIKRLDEVGKAEECLAFARQAVAEFPSEEKLQYNLAMQLHKNTFWEEKPDRALLDEAEKILQTLLDTTKDDEMRLWAITGLTAHYAWGVKEPDRALDMANRLPKMRDCREFAKSAYLMDENTEKYIQDEIDKLTDCLGTAIQNLALNDALPNDESTWERKIRLLQTSSELYRLIYGDDLLFYHCRLSQNAWLISTYQLSLGRGEDALASLEAMCRHAVAYDRAYAEDRGKRYTSPLVDKIIYPEISEEFHELEEHNDCWYKLDRLQSKRYDVLRDDPRFAAVVQELERYAK